MRKTSDKKLARLQLLIDREFYENKRVSSELWSMAMRRTVSFMLIIALFTYGTTLADEVSKRGTSAAPFLQFGVGGRATGMGKAFTAIANDVSSLYWNPAGMERLSSNSISFSYMNWIADMSFIHTGIVLKTNSIGSFGLSVTSLSTQEMLVRTVQEPEGLGWRFDAADMAIGLSYAKDLTERFSFGGTFKYIQRRIWHMEASAIAADFGILYSLPWEGMKLGISVTNFGSKLQMQGIDQVKSIDIDPNMAGNNSAVMTQLRAKEWALPLLFRFGLSYELIKSSSHSVILAMDVLHPNDNDESVNVGLEYGYSDLLMVRVGYQALFLDNAEEGLTCGIGLRMGGIGFDYSYNAMEHLGYVNQFTVQLAF
jgi:hypothetical protein